MPQQYVRDVNHSTASVAVNGHNIQLDIIDPVPENVDLGDGERAAMHVTYTVSPLPGTTNPCVWTGIVYDLTESGRLRLRRGLPSNFPLPVDAEGHILVRGVNA